jgi:hydroxymethylbilane synthase
MIQAALFKDAVGVSSTQATVEIIGVSTIGDRQRTIPIPDLGQGAFVKELEVSLVLEEIDVAAHSLKDLPTELPPGLTLGAVLTRADPRDALVSREGMTLAELPAGSRVGTGSPRRASQIRARRPDLEVVGIRGNIESRIRTVIEERDVDAVVLAVAGLARVGLSHLITEHLDPRLFLPAVGQGFLGIECREADEETAALLHTVEDSRARRIADLERAFLAAVGGFCRTPLAAFADIEEDGSLVLEGMIATHDGRTVLQERVTGDPTTEPAVAGNRLKDALFAQGAERIIAVAEEAWVRRNQRPDDD